MRKPLIIAVVAGAAAVITVGAISINGNKSTSVDPVADAPRPAENGGPVVINRPSRLDDAAPRAIPERPDDSRDVAVAPERGENDQGRRDWRRRPGLGDSPMAAEDWADRFEEMRKRRDEFMSRFDKDGDGEISEEEREAIGELFREQRRERMLARMTERFDANGDGELSEEERLVAEAEMEARNIERRARFVERFDTDGDGQLSNAENQAAREQFRRDRPGGDRGGRGGNPWREAVERYDADGDGELNLDESYEAYLDQFDRRTQQEFTRRYDNNGDGGVDTSDFGEFMQKYNTKDEAADVNGDGKIDQRDVERFQDLMVASQP